MRHYDAHLTEQLGDYKGLSEQDKIWLDAFNKATISANFSKLKILPISGPELKNLQKQIHRERSKRRFDIMNNGEGFIKEKNNELRKKCRCYQIADYLPSPKSLCKQGSQRTPWISSLGCFP